MRPVRIFAILGAGFTAILCFAFLNMIAGSGTVVDRYPLSELKIAKLCAALLLYRLNSGQMPTVDQGLQALVEKPAIGPIPDTYPEGGYVSPGEIIDAKGVPYEYIIIYEGRAAVIMADRRRTAEVCG